MNLHSTQQQSALRVPSLSHLSTLPPPLSPERKSHAQGSTISVCNQIPTNKSYKAQQRFLFVRTGDEHIPILSSSPWDKYKTKPTHTELCLYPCTQSPSPSFISDPPSCHCTCLILQGLQMPAFFRVLECLCAEQGTELHLLRL